MTEPEIEEDLFPDGNIQDFWLGNPPKTNSFLTDDPDTWTSMEEFLRLLRFKEMVTWTSERDLYVAAMRHDSERGGGLQGDTPALQSVRSQLTARGHKTLEWERKIGAGHRS